MQPDFKTYLKALLIQSADIKTTPRPTGQSKQLEGKMHNHSKHSGESRTQWVEYLQCAYPMSG